MARFAGRNSLLLMPREGGEACALAELVQFHCQLQHHRILCQPVERVFRMCPRRPAVEVTQLVEYDEHNKPYLPEAFAYVQGVAHAAIIPPTPIPGTAGRVQMHAM